LHRQTLLATQGEERLKRRKESGPTSPDNRGGGLDPIMDIAIKIEDYFCIFPYGPNVIRLYSTGID
jgi:hypothetical protein